MFSGIIETMGTVQRLDPVSGGKRLYITCPDGFFDGVAIGASIAINGACQTVEQITGDVGAFFSSSETLSVTNLAALKAGSHVNLEKALSFASLLDGHIVSGHVDAAGVIRSVTPQGESLRLTITVPSELLVYIAPKGSIAVDGISLTVNTVKNNEVCCTIIPHTYANTTLAFKKTADVVNIEVDLLARYVVRFFETHNAKEGYGRLGGLLKEKGYIQDGCDA